MRFLQSVAFTEPEQLIALARIAEEVGFDGVQISDHLLYPATLASKYPYTPDGQPPFGPTTAWLDAWALIAAMAAVTTRLRFVTGVYILPLRRPLEVAKATATAAVLSGNRVVLGAGAGWMKEEFDALGEDFKTRGRRLDEMIVMLRKLWAGGVVEHHGKFYDFDGLQMSPAPTRPVPIYIGGTSEAALRRAARLGDGWIGSGNAPEEVPQVVRTLRELRKAAGRDRLPFETVVALTVPPDVDLLRRLEDEGMTTCVSWPLAYTVGPTSTLDEKRRALERYGNEVIARAGGR